MANWAGGYNIMARPYIGRGHLHEGVWAGLDRSEWADIDRSGQVWAAIDRYV